MRTLLYAEEDVFVRLEVRVVRVRGHLVQPLREPGDLRVQSRPLCLPRGAATRGALRNMHVG